MRKQAIQKNYRLNESELVGAENITIKTEKDIFKVLDFEYKEPNDRTKWRMWDLNPRLFACKANTLPLS